LVLEHPYLTAAPAVTQSVASQDFPKDPLLQQLL